MPPSLRHPARPRTKSSNAIGDASDQEGNQWHFGMKAHIGVDAKSGLTHSLVTTAANEHDLNQLGNLLMERSNLSQPMPATKGATARGAGRGGCGLADRRAPRQGKNLETASTQEQNGHQHRYMKARSGQGGAPISHHQATVRLRESQIQGLLKNDNQLAMLFTLANLFRADQ
ncbi:IS5 transposase and trans-activator [Escherichia coli]|uniref:IS5 transposase and trans-activator n=1 Tax=Escherichia coli TaxID=562 RepID=A0A376TX80_ECOLX|nr:IS5 transposase and trans-activator [Escherichia coli]